MREALRGYAFTRRIEDLTAAGLPDIAYVVYGGHAGWIEAKYLPAWPKRRTSRVVIRSLTDQQVLFLEAWDRYGGTAFLALRVERWYGLLRPRDARAVLEKRYTHEDIAIRACGGDTGAVSPVRFVAALKMGSK